MAERRPRKDDIQMSLADKMIAYQRKNAQASASRPKSSRPAAEDRSQQQPAQAHTPDPDDFSRRLNISNTPRSRELYRPDVDPVSRRQPESHQHQSHPVPQRSPHPPHAAAAQRLFDPSRDDPLRFAHQQNHKASSRASQHPDWMSVSGSSVASSNAPSVLSSVLTLTSNTTGSEGSSQHQKTDESSNNSWLIQIKKLYRDLSACEAKLTKEPFDVPEEAKIVLKSRNQPNQQNLHNERLLRMISDHKHFTDICHTFLTLTLSPLVPASVHGFPTRCNIPSRLWASIHRPLETLRLLSSTSQTALEHFSDFIYFAYSFYSCLYEEYLLSSFKAYWLEALGDLARYRMALAAHLSPSPATASAASESFQTLAALPASEPDPIRENASASPSIGAAAAAAFELEPEREQWRNIARDWYGDGLRDQPGNGKLHHHIGLLCQDDETLRALYHYTKSMTVLHPFQTARESVQNLFGPALTAKRLQPEAKASDLFVVLHGMLFTNIQLDEFETILARFLEKLQLETLEEREWIMMAVTNLSAVLDYGRPNSVLRAAGVYGEKKEKETERPRAGLKRKNEVPVPEEEDMTRKMDVDDAEDQDDAQGGDAAGESGPRSDDDLPYAFSLALRLTFSMLRYVLRHPKHRRTPVAPSTLNPYIPVVFTFLATMFRHPRAIAVMERSIPWEEMVAFLSLTPRSVLNAEVEAGAKLTSGCDPSPEDWCLRGMEWLGRRVYERGFWSRNDNGGEMDFILEKEQGPKHNADDGIIEDDSDGANQTKSSEKAGVARRWTRVCRAAGMIGKAVPGFVWERQMRRWILISPMKDKVEHWNALEAQRVEELQRRQATRWSGQDDMDDDMDVDGDEAEASESSEDEDDDEQVKALRARRRHLRSLLQTNQHASPISPRRRKRDSFTHHANARRRLHIVAGYTILVVDTNILLSSLPMFSGLVKSSQWTVVVPLAVVTELDGLIQNPSPLGQAAKEAMRFISDAIRTHGSSLKVQTSKGNYLANSLVVRSEQVTFSKEEGSWERNMDDLILRSALWQQEHWVDRSSLLSGSTGSDAMADDGTSRVVLLTFDRNLRIKASSRQLDAADEKDMASILTPAA